MYDIRDVHLYVCIQDGQTISHQLLCMYVCVCVFGRACVLIYQYISIENSLEKSSDTRDGKS